MARSIGSWTQEWSRTSDLPDSEDGDPRRRYYRITPKGRRALELETTDLASILTVAKRRRVLKTS